MAKQKLKIALIDDDLEQRQQITQSLGQHGYELVASLHSQHGNSLKLQHIQADILLLLLDHPLRHRLEAWVSPLDLPTLLFTADCQQQSIQHAIEAGVSAYLIDDFEISKLESLISIAIEQHKKYQQLRDALSATQTKLSDRIDIEKAKRMLMQLQHLSEAQAFGLIRKNAMSHRISLGELSRRLLDVQHFLDLS